MSKPRPSYSFKSTAKIEKMAKSLGLPCGESIIFGPDFFVSLNFSLDSYSDEFSRVDVFCRSIGRDYFEIRNQLLRRHAHNMHTDLHCDKWLLENWLADTCVKSIKEKGDE